MKQIRSLLHGIVRRVPGYDDRNWLRVVQIDEWTKFLDAHSNADVLEISPGWNKQWESFVFRSYESASYPGFDICIDALPQQFDIVIADQVLEHVAKPVSAVSNMWKMLRAGGYALIATPFLFRVHGRPDDYARWTEAGLKQLLIDGGFLPENISVASWGNKSCARAHIGGPVRDHGFWRLMENDAEYPVMVWAIARKSTEAAEVEQQDKTWSGK